MKNEKTNKDILITIIVPVYNVEKYLKKCIDSIITQTYDNLEIILVDDGSTDSSGNICDEYKTNDSRIKVIHKINAGLSSARNAALEIATGELIGFVDSDDYIDPMMYEKLIKNMNKYHSDIAVCDFVFNGIKDSHSEKYKTHEFVSVGKEKFVNTQNDYSKISIVAWNKLYKRELFKYIKYPEGKLFEDRFIICDLYDKANSVSYIIEPLYNYLVRNGSIMQTISLKRLDWIDAFNKNISFYNDKGYLELAYNDTIKKCDVIIINLAKLKEKKIINKSNKEKIELYYYDLVNSSKEIKWKDANKHIRLFKLFGMNYIRFRVFEIRVWKVIKKVLRKK